MMVGRRFALACGAAALVILSAPFAQQLFTAVSTAWPRQLPAIASAAVTAPAVGVLLLALFRITSRRLPRYLSLLLGVGIGAGYILISGISYAERFHFVEYGLLAILFYRAWRPLEDASVVILPALAGVLAGTCDEWFQWFIPIRAGEARDVGLNAIAVGCGLLVAMAVDPPGPEGLTLRRESVPRIGAWAGTLVVVFGLFFQCVHLGTDVHDDEAGDFRSHYSGPALISMSVDRDARWRDRPPLVQRRVSREDQYLSEGLWHVQRRNRDWGEGNVFGAWHENLILEKFYAPVLDVPSYASASGQRWSPGQRTEAEGRAAADVRPYVSDAQPFPLYAWPKPLYWAAHLVLLAAIAALCRGQVVSERQAQ